MMTRRAWLAALVQPGAQALVVNAATGLVLRDDFMGRGRQPVGSLVKVFTAVAYGASHRHQFPTLDCKSGDCWYAAGHGRMGLVEAVARSCNSYFLVLARQVSHADVVLAAASYRVAAPLVDSPETRIGLGRGWVESPESIALAYLTLVRRRQEPGVNLIVEGLRQCARVGTAKVCGAGVLAKTGTSVCVHRPAMPGDGWALGMFPEDAPRYVAVVREHGVPGATAAARLGPLLRGVH